MDRFKNVVKRPVFHLFLFGLALAFFGWPFLSIPDSRQGFLIFSYLFVAWGVVITILFYMAGHLPDSAAEERTGGEAE
jgi:hypothetical protein